jgi:mono/diheme cytochrome c family protein
MTMKHIVTALAFAFAIPPVAAPQAQPRFQPAEVEHGRYLAIASDCAACHTAPGPRSPAMAGGYSIESPLGTIYSSNITPSRTAGIGNYTEAQFAGALRQGIRADGAHLYPGMPYTAYAGLSDGDVHALYAYFMQGVAPVHVAARPTKLPFPFNIRASMWVWNTLFLDKKPVVSDPAHDAQWNRGRYLAETLAHCSTCHSPRGFLMQEDHSKAQSGGQLGAWFAPNITSDKISGIGGWNKNEIALYLATGHVRGKAQAAGPMAEAVTNSFSQMTPPDIAALASYVATVPAVRDAGARQVSYAIGGPADTDARLRGQAASSEGAHLFSGLCSSCHNRDGSGTQDGVIPSLFHNSTVGAAKPDNLVAVILHGVDRTVGKTHVLMPGFGEKSFVQHLSDSQIAALATFVRQTYGPGDTVSEPQVAIARHGGAASLLLSIAHWGMAAGVALAVLFCVWLLRRRSRLQKN